MHMKAVKQIRPYPLHGYNTIKMKTKSGIQEEGHSRLATQRVVSATIHARIDPPQPTARERP